MNAAFSLCLLTLFGANTAIAGFVRVPKTSNPFIPVAAQLYESLEYEAALQTLDKASGWRENGATENTWIAMMGGTLRIELQRKDEALNDFKMALTLDPGASLPVDASPAVVRAFEKACAALGIKPCHAKPDPATASKTATSAPSAEHTPPAPAAGSPELPRGKPAPAQVPTVKSALPSATQVGLRIASELLLGGLGAAGLGVTGLMVGQTGGSIGGVVGMGIGLLGGAWCGVDLGGYLMGGTGNPWFTLLGALAGVVAALALPTESVGLLIAGLVALPVAGAITAYELTQTPSHRPLAMRGYPRLRFFPFIGMAPGGHTALAGLGATF